MRDPSIRLLDTSGIKISYFEDRRLIAPTSDPEIQILFVRAWDIPEFVYNGIAELGITGLDVVREANYDVELLLNLNFGKAKLVVAVPEDSDIKKFEDIPENSKIATQFPRITKEFFEKRGKRVRIVKVSGATEISPHIGVSDLIADLKSTGATLRMNRLREIDEILETSAYLIANKNAVMEKKSKIEEIILALKSVIYAEGKKLIMMNVPRDILEEIKRIIPGMAGPTISEVAADMPMVAVNAVVNENEVYQIITKAKKIGARDILVLPIERIVP